jgi:hypothetical protein
LQRANGDSIIGSKGQLAVPTWCTNQIVKRLQLYVRTITQKHKSFLLGFVIESMIEELEALFADNLKKSVAKIYKKKLQNDSILAN